MMQKILAIFTIVLAAVAANDHAQTLVLEKTALHEQEQAQAGSSISYARLGADMLSHHSIFLAAPPTTRDQHIEILVEGTTAEEPNARLTSRKERSVRTTKHTNPRGLRTPKLSFDEKKKKETEKKEVQEVKTRKQKKKKRNRRTTR